MHEVRERFGRQVCYLSAWLGFDVVTPERVWDIARSLLVLSATTWGGVQSIKGFATLRNVANLQFASKVRPEVARHFSKSVLSKSRLHKLHAFKEKDLGQKCLQSLRVKRFRLLEIIAARVIRNRKIEEKVRSFALGEEEAIWKAIRLSTRTRLQRTRSRLLGD